MQYRFYKTQDAPKPGVYQRTAVDDAKDNADFLLLQVNPYVIRWKDGRTETLDKRRLNKLQSSLNWMTHF